MSAVQISKSTTSLHCKQPASHNRSASITFIRVSPCGRKSVPCSISSASGGAATTSGVATRHSHGAGILVHSNKLSFCEQFLDIVIVRLSRSQCIVDKNAVRANDDGNIPLSRGDTNVVALV